MANDATKITPVDCQGYTERPILKGPGRRASVPNPIATDQAIAFTIRCRANTRSCSSCITSADVRTIASPWRW